MSLSHPFSAPLPLTSMEVSHLPERLRSRVHALWTAMDEAKVSGDPAALALAYQAEERATVAIRHYLATRGKADAEAVLGVALQTMQRKRPTAFQRLVAAVRRVVA